MGGAQPAGPMTESEDVRRPLMGPKPSPSPVRYFADKRSFIGRR